MTMRMRTNTAMTSTTTFAADAFSCTRAAFHTATLILDVAFAASIFVVLLALVLVSLLSLLNITLITLISLLVVLVVLLIPVRLKR